MCWSGLFYIFTRSNFHQLLQREGEERQTRRALRKPPGQIGAIWDRKNAERGGEFTGIIVSKSLDDQISTGYWTEHAKVAITGELPETKNGSPPKTLKVNKESVFKSDR